MIIGRDVGELSRILKTAVPSADIVPRTINDTIIMTGSVDSAADAQMAIDIAKGFDASGLDDVVRDLYQYWKPGMTPPSFDDLVPEAAAESAASAAGGEAAGPEAEYLRRVPAALVERSRAALAKWKANH